MAFADLSNVLPEQLKFLRNGGLYEIPMRLLRQQGLLPQEGKTQSGQDYQEYPKQISPGVLAHSEEEEERLLSGGLSNEALEEERQVLIRRARQHKIIVDDNWSTVRLKRELGMKLDEAPGADNRLAQLQAELAHLNKIKELEAQIAAMKAGETVAEEISESEMRAELIAVGVQVDGRWSSKKLREVYEQHTQGE